VINICIVDDRTLPARSASPQAIIILLAISLPKISSSKYPTLVKDLTLDHQAKAIRNGKRGYNRAEYSATILP